MYDIRGFSIFNFETYNAKASKPKSVLRFSTDVCELARVRDCSGILF